MGKPAYRKLLKQSEISTRAEALYQRLSACDLCPRNCAVDRLQDEIGSCGVGELAWVCSWGPHLGEEAPLRGQFGSGTIFFSGCNLHCVYCQNADISQQLSGQPVDPSQLADMMIGLQERGCHNINLVSPTHVVAQIVQALALAAKKGLSLPVVYNTGGYDSLKTLAELNGLVDIYMPDMKYSHPETGEIYSGVSDYPEVNRNAVLEMHRQVGDLRVREDGIAVRGLLVRHLVLPENLAGSEAIFQFIASEVSTTTYLNIMDQYHPAYLASRFQPLRRRVTRQEYRDAVALAQSCGLKRLDRV